MIVWGLAVIAPIVPQQQSLHGWRCLTNSEHRSGLCGHAILQLKQSIRNSSPAMAFVNDNAGRSSDQAVAGSRHGVVCLALLKLRHA